MTTAVLLLLFWILLATLVPHALIPGPVETLQAAFTIVTSDQIWNLVATLSRTLVAFILTLLISLLTALVAQSCSQVKAVIKEIMSLTIRIPTIAYITFFVLLFGTGEMTIYAAVATAVIPVTTLSIIGLYDSINPDLDTINKVYRVPFLRQAVYLYLPVLMETFHSIFLIGYSLTFKSLIMAEFFAGLSGLGYGLMIQRETLDLRQLTAYILIITCVGFISQKILERGAHWLARCYASA